MKPNIITIATLALAAAAFAAPAQAGLNGTTVAVDYHFPDYGDIYSEVIAVPPSFVVAAGSESLINVENVTYITVDFTDNGLSLLFNTVLENPTWTNFAFNGLVFTGPGFETVTGLSILPSSTFGAGNPGELNFSLVGNELRLDWGGVTYHDGEVLNLSFPNLHGDPDPNAVPEPATWAMFIAGFGLVGATMRRRRPALAIVTA